MKVVFICSEYPPGVTGGIGTFTCGLGEALASRGHQVYVVGHYDLSLPEREAINGVHVSRLPRAGGLKSIVADRFSLSREIARIAAGGEIDLIEAPDFEGPTAGLPRRSRIRIVRLHGSHCYFADERGIRHSPTITLMEKFALRQADAIASVSNYTARRTTALFNLPTKITTIHNAVNVPARFPRKTDYREQKQAVYFGTLAEKKGVLALAEAWREFHRTHPDWRLTMIGRDSIHAGKSVKVTMLHLLEEAASTVDFAGYMPNSELLSRLATFDFAVLPSFSEAFALAPLESMALGLPVVYSSMSSGPELIDHGVDGWLCDPRSVPSIVDALLLASKSEAERKRLGQNARASVEGRFSYEAFVDRNIAYYESLFASRSQAR